MIYKGFENAWFNCRHLNQNFNQKQRARALVAAACMKFVADCFQMLGTVRTHWTWCSLIWGWWRARQAKARSLMYLMASVTTRSAETFLPIASSIWRSMAIFWNWKKPQRKLRMLFIQIKRSIKTMIVVGFFFITLRKFSLNQEASHRPALECLLVSIFMCEKSPGTYECPLLLFGF